MIAQLYVRKASVVHNLSFWVKFLCLLLLLPLAAFVSSARMVLLLLAVFAVLLVLSKIGFGRFWKVAGLYIISISIGVMMLSLLFSGGVVSQRLVIGLVLAARFSALICFGVLFSMVTNPIEIPVGFVRARIPHRFGVTLMVGFRMMPLISKKISAVIDAQRARGAEIKLSLRKLPKLFQRLAALMIPILHSTLESSVKLSDTLISRGYNPDGKITIPPGKLNAADFVVFFTSAGVLVLAFAGIL